MAEEKNNPYTLDAYNPFFTERKWVPFYKRYTFTGASQADQAANLVTSPSFTQFWSGGGNQTDNISAVRVTSPVRERDVTALRNKYDIDATPPQRPPRPVPPEGIRNIEWGRSGFPRSYYNKEGFYYDGNFKYQIPEHLTGQNLNRWAVFTDNYDWHPDSPYRPATNQGTYPLLTHAEHNWWNNALHGDNTIDEMGLKKSGWHREYELYDSRRLKFKSIPAPLRNEAGAMVRSDRELYSTLRYFTDGSQGDVFRGVNASSPANQPSLSAEFSLYNKGGRFVPPIRGKRWNSDILFYSSPDADLAMDTRTAQRVVGQGDVYRLNDRAVAESNSYLGDTPKLKQSYTVSSSMLDDIPEVEPEPVILRKRNLEQARKVGSIRRDEIKGVGKDGKTWTDSRPSTTTTIYGPPTKGMLAETIANNTLHYGGKTLGAVGSVIEGVSIPRRSYELINDLRRIRGEPIMTQPYDIMKYPDARLWEQAAGQVLGTLEAGANFVTLGITDSMIHPEWNEPLQPVQRGYYSDQGQKVPNWVPNLQSTYQGRPRYERQGVSFNHIYPKPPL